MSGRVFDLITAENFAKWAEGRGELRQMTHESAVGYGCAGAQFLQSLGFARPVVGVLGYACEVPPGMAAYDVTQSASPGWLYAVVRAWDDGERSGPALAKIARENA